MNLKKLFLPAILGIACVFGQATEKVKEAAEKTADVTKDAVKKTGRVSKKVAEKTVDVTKDAAKATGEGTKKVAVKTAEVTKDAAKATGEGTKKVAVKTADVTKDAAKATGEGAKKVAEKTVDGTKKGVEVTKDAVTKKKPEAKVEGGMANAGEIASAKAKGLVWVNLDSKIYHREGQFYGTTKNGKFMTEAEAVKMGGTASKASAAKK